MKQNSIDIVRAIIAPAKLHCVGTDGGILLNRLELRSFHVLKSHGLPQCVSFISNIEVRELLGWSNGFRLFDRSSYSPSDVGCALDFFCAEDLPRYKSAFCERIALNMQYTADEWNRWFLENGRAVEGWINGLLPLASIGEGGDILALDTTIEDSRPDGLRFLYLDFDTYVAGPFDADYFDLRWESLADFWRWYASDLVQRLESTWRYTDQSGEQFFVRSIEFTPSVGSGPEDTSSHRDRNSN